MNDVTEIKGKGQDLKSDDGKFPSLHSHKRKTTRVETKCIIQIVFI